MILAIIDHLHDDKPSLKACSLVCKAWSHPARVHLISELTVSPSDYVNSPLLLLATFPFARDLRIDGPGNLSIILPLLVGNNRLRSLHLTRLRVDRFSDPSLLNLSGVVTLRLWSIFFPDVSSLAQLVCAFPRLQTLHLSCIAWDRIGLPPPTGFCLSPNLLALELKETAIDSIIMWLLSLPVRLTLRSVTLGLRHIRDEAVFRQFISALGNSDSLEFFSFPALFDHGTLSSPSLPLSVLHPRSTLGRLVDLDLSRLTRVRSIRILFKFFNPECAWWLTRVLSHISSVHLEEIALEFKFSDYMNHGSQAWDQVDAILQNSTFSGLRKVELCCPPASESTLAQEIASYMPRCRARGIICAGGTRASDENAV